MLNEREIQEILPHRYPFLLVDRILEMELGKRIVGIKNVTINEPFFVGHFPGHPIMPGVLIVEAIAQVGGLLLMSTLNVRGEKKVLYFTGIDRARFRRPVRPGDQVRMEVEFLQLRGRNCRMRGRATVEGARAAEVDMSCVVMDRGEETGSADSPLGV